MWEIITEVGIWRVATITDKKARAYVTSVRHVNEEGGEHEIIRHQTPSQAKCDHAMAVELIGALVRKITKHGHKDKRAVPDFEGSN